MAFIHSEMPWVTPSGFSLKKKNKCGKTLNNSNIYTASLTIT